MRGERAGGPTGNFGEVWEVENDPVEAQLHGEGGGRQLVCQCMALSASSWRRGGTGIYSRSCGGPANSKGGAYICYGFAFLDLGGVDLMMQHRSHALKCVHGAKGALPILDLHLRSLVERRGDYVAAPTR